MENLEIKSVFCKGCNRFTFPRYSNTFEVTTDEERKEEIWYSTKCHVALQMTEDFPKKFPWFKPVRGCGYNEADGAQRFFADKFIDGGDFFDDGVHHYGEVLRIEEHGE